MSGTGRTPAEVDVHMLSARELLRVIGDLFAELMPVEAGAASEAELEQAALLRRALAEVAVRVSRLCPVVSPTACSCGKRFTTAEDLEEHLDTVFVPPDDVGLDGRQHAEVL
jgi:hypothetical protein